MQKLIIYSCAVLVSLSLTACGSGSGYGGDLDYHEPPQAEEHNPPSVEEIYKSLKYVGNMTYATEADPYITHTIPVFYVPHSYNLPEGAPRRIYFDVNKMVVPGPEDTEIKMLNSTSTVTRDLYSVAKTDSVISYRKNSALKKYYYTLALGVVSSGYITPEDAERLQGNDNKLAQYLGKSSEWSHRKEEIELLVDFANKKITGTIDRRKYNIKIVGDIRGSGFYGTVQDSDKRTGLMYGQFNGPNAEEISIVYYDPKYKVEKFGAFKFLGPDDFFNAFVVHYQSDITKK